MTKKNEGKLFEEDFKNSCTKEDIFFHRIRDVYIPYDLRKRVRVQENPYDSFVYYNGYLFPMEAKSIKQKSFPLSESMIKQHQIDNLTKALDYKGLIPGFLFNFRIVEETYFLHINDFNNYVEVAKGNKKPDFESKVNQASVPLSYCREKGYLFNWDKPRTRYKYHVKDTLNEIVEVYSNV